jgi:mono/diheme cytochrome c family protein
MRGRPAAVLAAVALALAGCGGGTGEVPADPTPEVSPGATGLPDPDSRGARVLTDSGCLACHRLAGRGNAGPGQDLDGVGERLDEEGIRAALTEEPDSMPSYEGLPPASFEALVDYLAALR